jgi:HlyD family secretion protein
MARERQDPATGGTGEDAAPAAPAAVPPAETSPLSEMLTQEPSRIARRLLYGLLLFLAAAIAVASFVKVDVTISAPAVAQPEGKAVLIQAEGPVTVVAVKVREGDAVRKGQELMTVSSDEVGNQLLALTTAAAELEDSRKERRLVVPLQEQQLLEQVLALDEKIASLNRVHDQLKERLAIEKESFRLAQEHSALELEKQGEIDRRAAVDLANAESAVVFRQRDLESLEKLRLRQAVSAVEVLASRRALEDATATRDKVRSQERENANTRARLRNEVQSTEQQHLKALRELSEQIEKNEADVREARSSIVRLRDDIRLKRLEADKKEQLASARYTQAYQRAELALRGVDPARLEQVLAGESLAAPLSVTAPVEGRVGPVAVRRAGEVVPRGQALLTLLPEGVELMAELRIANRDVGLVREGQEVKLKFDAFPFAEYGAIAGRLTNVVLEAETGSGGETYFRATASLGQQYFRKNGEAIPLRSGMTATAEIRTEQKTILELLLRPFLEVGQPSVAKP